MSGGMSVATGVTPDVFVSLSWINVPRSTRVVMASCQVKACWKIQACSTTVGIQFERRTARRSHLEMDGLVHNPAFNPLL